MKRTSQLKIRRIFNNENSTKDQVTVQFAQTTEGTGNPLLALTQGISGTGIITCLVSFARKQAVALFGADTYDAPDLDDPETYMDAPEVLANAQISVVENTVRNPNQPNQQPKIDPRTNEVLGYNGEPIYRHTELCLDGNVKTELLVYTERLGAESKAETKSADAQMVVA